MSFSRQQTSLSRLNIQWTPGPGDNSLGIESFEDAIDWLTTRSGGKPLMLYRETKERDEKVAKLLTAALKSERFALASHWFQCIKVGDEVLSEHHPLNPLFEGRHPAALVLMTADNSKSVSFLGKTSQKVKWTPIASVLKAAYKKNPTRAVKELEKLLCTFDKIDARAGELNKQLARAEKKEDKKKIASIQKDLAELDQDRDEAYAEEEKLRDLVLKADVADE